MKINLEIVEAACVYAKESIEDLNTKALVPKMVIRRRLSRASKIALYLSSKVSYTDERIVFGSSYGELPSTENILNSISKKEPISPTQFQNSVYNIPVSYLSMLSNNTNEIMTISSGDKTALNTLKMGAVKALDGDEILLMVVEALNVDAVKQVNKCIDYLECGVALKVRVCTQIPTLQIKNNNTLKLPPSIVALFNLAKDFDKSKKNIVEVTL